MRKRVAILVGCHRCQKIARVSEAVGADRSSFRQGEGSAVILAQIAARRPSWQFDANLHAARDHGDLAWHNVNDAELRAKAEFALLLYEEHFAIGIVEVFVHHRAGHEIDMCAHAGLRSTVTGGGNCANALHKGQWFVRDSNRVPA